MNWKDNSAHESHQRRPQARQTSATAGANTVPFTAIPACRARTKEERGLGLGGTCDCRGHWDFRVGFHVAEEQKCFERAVGNQSSNVGCGERTIGSSGRSAGEAT